MGEQELATEMDFSRVGRVNAMLARRLELLAEVKPLPHCHYTKAMTQAPFCYMLVTPSIPLYHCTHNMFLECM